MVSKFKVRKQYAHSKWFKPLSSREKQTVFNKTQLIENLTYMG